VKEVGMVTSRGFVSARVQGPMDTRNMRRKSHLVNPKKKTRTQATLLNSCSGPHKNGMLRGQKLSNLWTCHGLRESLVGEGAGGGRGKGIILWYGGIELERKTALKESEASNKGYKNRGSNRSKSSTVSGCCVWEKVTPCAQAVRQAAQTVAEWVPKKC